MLNVLLGVHLNPVATVVLSLIIGYKCITILLFGISFYLLGSPFSCKELKNKACMFNVKLSTVS